MKKNFKRIFAIFLTIATLFTTVVSTYAETAPNSFYGKHYKLSDTPMTFPATFRVKKTTDGKYIYCAHYAKTPPVTSVKYTKGKVITDKGMNYILNEAYSVSNDKDFFIYQTALWIYMIDKGLMPQPYSTLTTFKSKVNNSSSATAKTIKNIVSAAKKASANDTTAPTISVDTNNTKFTLNSDRTYYVSNGITVNSSTGSYDVTLTNAPSGTKYEKSGNNLIIKVPVSSVTSSKTNVEFKVNNSKVTYTSYYYNPSNSKYQVMTATYKDTKTADDKASLSIEKTSISISKQDITSKEELPGATLVIKDENGKEIEKWVSTNQKHVIENLPAGTYTLTEIIAPEGYVLSSETITFTIDDKGNLYDKDGNSIAYVVMYNEKEAIPEEPKLGGVCVSKQDVTNGKEIAGAKLVIKDYDGNIVHEWISEEGKSECIELKPGIYTLTETMQPEGYILSTETITFTVKEDGSITKVVMYNTPDKKETVEVPVEDTASYKTVTSSLIGILVIAIGSVLVFKTSKKETDLS